MNSTITMNSRSTMNYYRFLYDMISTLLRVYYTFAYYSILTLDFL